MKEVEDGDMKEKIKYCSDRDDESTKQPPTLSDAARRIIERFDGNFGLVNEPVNGLAWSVIAKALLNIIELYSSLN
ncbi:hypothetical protein M0R45_031156 [Rubus argutus]|uniref:Uncharacterized protein n=1 Tax=Rubus argutus TaxID=59490 RepID=A0AAW1WD57_RUBAR